MLIVKRYTRPYLKFWQLTRHSIKFNARQILLQHHTIFDQDKAFTDTDLYMECNVYRIDAFVMILRDIRDYFNTFMMSDCIDQIRKPNTRFTLTDGTDWRRKNILLGTDHKFDIPSPVIKYARNMYYEPVNYKRSLMLFGEILK